MITDTQETFETIVSMPREWPLEYQKKITIQYLAESYPKDRLRMRDLWRTCATQRLFLPGMLLGEDAVIYIDTDFLFMRPPEDLWDIFNDFNATQSSAVAPYIRNFVNEGMVSARQNI